MKKILKKSEQYYKMLFILYKYMNKEDESTLMEALIGFVEKE